MKLLKGLAEKLFYIFERIYMVFPFFFHSLFLFAVAVMRAEFRGKRSALLRAFGVYSSERAIVPRESRRAFYISDARFIHTSQAAKWRHANAFTLINDSAFTVTYSQYCHLGSFPQGRIFRERNITTAPPRDDDDGVKSFEYKCCGGERRGIKLSQIKFTFSHAARLSATAPPISLLSTWKILLENNFFI